MSFEVTKASDRKFLTSINILVNKGIDKLSTHINTSKECEVKRFFEKGSFPFFAQQVVI